MNGMTRIGRVVATCTHDWYQIVTRDEELTLSDGWDACEADPAACRQVCEVIGVPALDDVGADVDAWVARVEAVDERHTAIRVGDYCYCAGYGTNVTFVRLETV